MTRPTYLTEAYGFGFNYRRKFLKDWLFIAVEPAYFWDAYFWDRDMTDQRRVGAPQFISRLEILFD